MKTKFLVYNHNAITQEAVDNFDFLFFNGWFSKQNTESIFTQKLKFSEKQAIILEEYEMNCEAGSSSMIDCPRVWKALANAFPNMKKFILEAYEPDSFKNIYQLFPNLLEYMPKVKLIARLLNPGWVPIIVSKFKVEKDELRYNKSFLTFYDTELSFYFSHLGKVHTYRCEKVVVRLFMYDAKQLGQFIFVPYHKGIYLNGGKFVSSKEADKALKAFHQEYSDPVYKKGIMVIIKTSEKIYFPEYPKTKEDKIPSMSYRLNEGGRFLDFVINFESFVSKKIDSHLSQIDRLTFLNYKITGQAHLETEKGKDFLGIIRQYRIQNIHFEQPLSKESLDTLLQYVYQEDFSVRGIILKFEDDANYMDEYVRKYLEIFSKNRMFCVLKIITSKKIWRHL